MRLILDVLRYVRGNNETPAPHKGQWRRGLKFSLICAWINGWINNREAGDLRRHRAHYDVIVIYFLCTIFSVDNGWMRIGRPTTAHRKSLTYLTSHMSVATAAMLGRIWRKWSFTRFWSKVAIINKIRKIHKYIDINIIFINNASTVQPPK